MNKLNGVCVMPVAAYILVNVAVGRIQSVIDKLKEIEGVRVVSFTAGQYDVIVRVEVETLEDLFYLTERIHEIEGIERTNTHVVEKEIGSL